MSHIYDPPSERIYRNFEIRLAASDAEVEAAQALRYRVFYEEMGALASPETAALKRDFDAFDPICDHLLVIDRAASGDGPAVVGTYRILRRSIAKRHDGFYTMQEFDLGPLMDCDGEIAEVGRSCVAESHRLRGVMPLLWRGLADYIEAYGIKVLFGCASFPGTDLARLEPALSYLAYYHTAPAGLRPRALDHRYVPMERMPRHALDAEAAADALPPLIKGYLRLGGFVGRGAVVDEQFRTTDVCIIVKTDQLTAKYQRHYKQSGTHSANSPALNVPA